MIGRMTSDGATSYTRINLTQVEDSAPKFGYGERQEARFASGDLELVDTGVSYHRIKPGQRQGFGHRHEHAEEVYIVLAGSGRIRIDDDVVELAARDAIRVAPACLRAFEASPEGLEIVAVGQHWAKDGEVVQDFWTD
jgi:mannose-6-phosphate isomerase-like protein (cupin superfamily)